MKQPSDKFTSEIFGNRRGRPNKERPLSGAERMREYRKRQAQKLICMCGRTKQECANCPF